MEAREEESDIFSAAKTGELGLANRLITDGVDVNSSDDHGNLPVDYAWTNKYYDVVLLLLKADSKFPKEFNLDQLNDDSESAQNLKTFFEERNLLHQRIEDEDLERVQELVSNSKSKFYFNKKNQSAAYAAIKSRKIQIYAYLQSIGAEFSGEDEKKELDKLELKDKVALKDALVPHFPGVSGGHIFYLISKSKSQKPVEGLEEKLREFYSKLDKIPEISMILKVIQHADYLQVVFDFNEESVARVNPTVSENTKGETHYKEGRLYIGASQKRGEEKILGTIAHELTHMAMQILFENECKPYMATDEDGEKHFDELTRKTLRTVKKIEDAPSKIILNVEKGYEEKDHHCELIVTVPQILVECKFGKQWLREKAPELFAFYNDIIMPKCQEFDEKSVIRKIQMEVKKLNETLGEIIQLKKSNVTFGNLSVIMDLLNDQEKKILILKTRNTFLGMMKVLQGIFGESYVSLYDKYLLADFSGENSTPPLKDILETFLLDTCDTLIIRCMDDSYENVLKEGFLETAWDIFIRKPNKKLIFVVHPNVEEILLRTLKRENMMAVCAEKRDVSTSINDLSEKSKKEISGKKVIFQGGEIVLSELTAADENIYKLVTGDVIENLIQGNKVPIGEKTFDHNYLRDFSYVDQVIKLRTFINEFKKSKDVFVIEGVNGKEALFEHFKELIENRLINQQTLANQVHIAIPGCFEIGNKRLILANDNFSEENFQTLCRHNWDKKIYLIEVKNAKFVLKQLYNPNFYLERKFKIMTNQGKLEDLILNHSSETFIISTMFASHIELGRNYENVKIVKAEAAQSVFNEFVKDKTTVHWFHVQGRKEIYWKNSSGSSSSSWLDFTNLKTNDKCLIEEKDMITHVADKKVIIIADNPGMGKSTTLTKLYESPTIAQTHWVIRIDLKGQVEPIKKINDLSIKTIIDFLKRTKTSFANKLTQDLLESALRPDGAFTTRVLFAFDGFDELLDDGARTTIIDMLKYLQNNTRSKIWITTRLHYKDVLEQELSTSSFQFDPIDDESKGIYINRYLQERLKVTFEPEMAEDIFDPRKFSKVHFYTEKFLNVMKYIFSKNAETFIGTPLQLYLMTENSVQHFKNWIDGNSPMVDFSHLGNNIVTVFEHFINGKYEIYFKKQNILEEFMKGDAKEQAEEYHKALAESLTRNKALGRKHEKKSPLMLLIGLIQSGDENALEFIHFTFREYFAALIFRECVSDESSEFKPKLKYLVDLLEKKEFLVIRNFINFLLEDLNFEKLPEDNLKAFKDNFSISGSELSATMKKILINSVTESNGFILDFIIFICGELTEALNMDMLTTNCHDDENLLQFALFEGDLQITKTLFQKIEKLSTENQKKILGQLSDFGTILELAVIGRCCAAVKIVLEKLEAVLEPNELKLYLKEILLDHPLSTLFRTEETFSTMRYRFQESLFFFLGKKGNKDVTLLLLDKVREILSVEQQKEIIMMDNKNYQNILFAVTENGHVELTKILLSEIGNILSCKEQVELIGGLCQKYPFISVKSENVVHLAARQGNIELISIFFEKYKQISWEKEFLTMENSKLKTILHIATQKGHTELIKILIKKMDEVLSPEEQLQLMKKQVGFEETVFHLAAKRGNAEVINIWFEKCEDLPDEERKELIMTPNIYSQTILYVVAQKGRTELMKMILRKMGTLLSTEAQEELIMMTDNNSQTILHTAVDYGQAEIVKTILETGISFLSPEEQRDFIMTTDYYDETALHFAVISDDHEITSILLEKSEELSFQKEFIMMESLASKTVFHTASLYGYAKLLKTLLKKAEEILSPEELKGIIVKEVKNHSEVNKETVVHLAARSGNFEILTIWLGKLSPEEQNEMIVMKNSVSHNILYAAAESDHNEFIKALLEKINEMLSVEEQKEFILTMSNISSHSDKNRETVVHLVARRGNTELMKLILEKSKELSSLKEFITIKNSSSKTAYHVAAREGDAEMVKILQEAMNEVLSIEEQGEIIMRN